MYKTDEELAGSAKNGEDASFQELMRRYLKAVFNFAYQYMHNTEEAEDVTQETFFKTWKHIKKFKSGKAWKPWLFAIARNTALDHFRKRKEIPFSSLDNGQDNAQPGNIQFEETIEDTELSASEVFEQAQDIRELGEAMDKLHPENRLVLILHYHEEMTFEEIAIVMNRSMNTVKSWHRRGLGKIKSMLSVKHAPK